MVSKYEQETVISRAGDEDIWHVWSTDQRVMGRIRRIAERLQLKVDSGKDGGPWVEVLVPGDRVEVLHVRKAGLKPEGQRKEDLLRRLRRGRDTARSQRSSGGRPTAATGQVGGRDAEELLPMGREVQ